jgi:exonuclease III
MLHPKPIRNFKIGYKNIQGLHNKNGCKIGECSKEFFNEIEIISETWGCNCDKKFDGYELIAESEPQKNPGVKKGRKSGGIIVLCKQGLQNIIKVLKISKNFIWVEISKNVIQNLENNLVMVSAYIHDASSTYFKPPIFDELSADIVKFCDEKTPLILMGDLNSRTGVEDEKFVDKIIDSLSCIETNNTSIDLPPRKNCDPVVNSHGKNLINICRTFNLKILNGRKPGDPIGINTYNDINLGSSTIDYGICSQEFYEHVKNFMVLPQNEISDHCKIISELSEAIPVETPKKDEYNWVKPLQKYIWDPSSAQYFHDFIENSRAKLDEIQQRIEAGLIESSAEKIKELFIITADNILKKKPELKAKKHKGNSKKWFNRECLDLKKEVRKIGRDKHKDPLNEFLRDKYRKKLREFKRQCHNSRKSFWDEKFDFIEKTLHDPSQFWNTWKNCSETNQSNPSTGIGGGQWYNYFSNLHSEKSNDSCHHFPETTETPDEWLNKPFTKSELLKIIKYQKKGKAVGFDNVSNEMLKSSPDALLTLILAYINLCLKKSLISASLCYDIINPMFKDGSRSDPQNYRGICISSAILKLITSLIHDRMKSKVNELNLIHKNQIGFKQNCRTADHLLTLKTVVKKYVTVGGNKLFACFVDFKKAFDSVWHSGLYKKLEALRLHGNLLCLIKDIYKKTKCAVKSDNKITQFFNFTKGVRQGCPLSPLLFNLYVNDIFQLLDNSTCTPFLLNDNNQVNTLMYADDLVILGKSEDELQTKLNQLSEYCKKWKLEINVGKTKCMVFSRGGRLYNTNLKVNNVEVENVKSFKYLGFTIGAKNCSFLNTPNDLSIKASRAIFSLNNKIKLSMLPTKLALKVFSSQIAPILLYGSEVWAPYSNFNFENWDKSTIERCHTQFLKRLIGCNIHTPNLMVRAELGKRPLLYDVITRSILYIKHLESIPGTLANCSLDTEASCLEKCNILSLVRQFSNYYSEGSNYLSPKNKEEVKIHSKTYYDAIWRGQLSEMSKADSFSLFKSTIGLEKYTWAVKNYRHRNSLARLRLSAHKLMIEKGRHHKVPLARSERKCPSCLNSIEDECHFLITCPLYENERQILFTEVRLICRSFDNIPTDKQKFIYLMTQEDNGLLARLAAFVFKASKIREEFMCI